jgi:hypothetical protein
MQWGWRCGADLKGRQMRAHFTTRAKRRRPPTTWTAREELAAEWSIPVNADR